MGFCMSFSHAQRAARRYRNQAQKPLLKWRGHRLSGGVISFSKSRSLQSIKNPSVTSRQLPFQVSKRGLAADNLCVIIAVPLSERVTHEYRSAPPVTPLPRQLKYMVGAGKAKPLI